MQPVPVVRSQCVLTQRLGQAALDGVGRGRRRAKRGGGPDIGVIDASSQPAAKGAGQHGILRFEFDKRLGPCRIYVRFRAAQKSGADRNSGRAKRQSRRDPAPVADATRRDHRDGDHVGDAGDQGKQSHALSLGRGSIEGAAMAARLDPLRDDCVRPRLLCADRLGDGRRGGKPGNPAGLEGGDKFGRKERHDRGDHAGFCRKQRCTLPPKIRQARIAGLRSNLGAPLRQETPDFLFGLRIARGRRIRNP